MSPFSTKFKEKAIEIHGNKYDYSKVVYKGNKQKICIICPIHGEFWQRPDGHLWQKQGCPECGRKASAGSHTLDKKDFINRAIEIHGNKYDYSKTEFSKGNEKTLIICPIHGEFKLSPNMHLYGVGCKKCGYKKCRDKFVKDFWMYVPKGSNYDYSKVVYIDHRTPVCIICPIHGEFWQSPECHRRGQKCARCSTKENALKIRKTFINFVETANKIHGDKYDYSLSDYETRNKKIQIICKKHGVFIQSPKLHITGSGCPKCSESHGEKMIRLILDSNNITYIREKTFDGLIGLKKGRLRFDFYLPDANCCIEFDGPQHYFKESCRDPNQFYVIQNHDKRKNDYCKNKNIDLIRIRYNSDIKSMIDKFLQKNENS